MKKDCSALRSKRRNDSGRYNTDHLAIEVYNSLIGDFRRYFGSDFCRNNEFHYGMSLQEFRELKHPDYSNVSAPLFKAHAQMENLLKKYRFKDDVYTDAQLESLTVDKFLDTQKRLCQPQGTRCVTTHAVLQEARKIVRSIIGEFAEDRLVPFLKFGKKSSIGCPLHLAYIDEKLSNVAAFTGSSSCADWFKTEVLAKDAILLRILERLLPDIIWDENKNLQIESLTFKTVPKSWKILRGITPMTLLSLYLSNGIGGVITEDLRAYGLNISSLQHKHRRYVKIFSRTRTHVTADLSAASDSLTSELCNAVLPRSWYVVLKRIMTHQQDIVLAGKKRRHYVASVLPMGNGATFPLETLIFYSLIKGIGNLTGVRGTYSAYGDDLIYPTMIHKYVKVLFPRLGLLINEDKTFVSSHFRESCGADFLHGVDVRPFYFPGEHRMLTRSKYIAEIYKIYNGLTRRWGRTTIRGTLYLLLKKLAQCECELFRVPPSYPDTSGIRIDCPTEVPLDCFLLPWAPIQQTFSHGSRWFRFSYLLERSSERFVKYVEPYYWLTLCGDRDEVEEYSKFWNTPKYTTESTPQLSWRKFKRYRKFFSKRKGKWVKKVIVKYRAFVSQKESTKVVIKTTKDEDASSDWV